MTTPRASRPEPAFYFLPADAGTGLLDWAAVRARFAAAENYWVSTASPEGAPHAMPVWGVWLDEAFVFSTSPVSRKGRNLTQNPRVAVHLESGEEVVVIEGEAEVVRDADRIARFKAAYDPKYRWDLTPEQLAIGGIFAVRPRKAFAWRGSRNPAFGGSATRFRFDPGDAHRRTEAPA